MLSPNLLKKIVHAQFIISLKDINFISLLKAGQIISITISLNNISVGVVPLTELISVIYF